MVFTSHIFIFYFLPCVLLFYYLLPRIPGLDRVSGGQGTRWRNGLLLAASYIFYGWWNPWYVLLMFAATVMNYACGLVMAQPGATDRRRRQAVTVAVVLSLLLLGFFKYFGFFQENLNHALAWFGAPTLGVLQVLLPVGISFYIFHTLSYTIDVYRGKAPPAQSFTDFACYIALFPQLVAGPIVRYNTVAGQLVRRVHSLERFSSGISLFVLGFAKKILLANPVGLLADAAFGADHPGVAEAWFGATAYAFQIYFDFSGYSDMAVGLGRMFGFEFPQNFNSPYSAQSITDFWRRWHISLSSFLRDYLYIPLGGNRRGEARTYFNLAVVMLLGGLWHGASWTFVMWGAYHGLWLCLERWRGDKGLYGGLPAWMRIGITFVLVLFSWVLFRSENFGDALGYLGAMFGFVKGGSEVNLLLPAQLYTLNGFFSMTVCAFWLLVPVRAQDWSDRITWPKAMAIAPTFAAALLLMTSQSFNPFLYFQF